MLLCPVSYGNILSVAWEREKYTAELPWNSEFVTVLERGVLVSDWLRSDRQYSW